MFGKLRYWWNLRLLNDQKRPEEMRAAAIRALAKSGDPRAFDCLLGMTMRGFFWNTTTGNFRGYRHRFLQRN